MGGTFYHLVSRLDRIGSDSTRPGRMCDYVCATVRVNGVVKGRRKGEKED